MSYTNPEIEKRILKFFNNKTNGFFVDIGAYDGIAISNTKLLEDIGWDGICIEPHPKVYERLVKNRTCKKINCALWNEDTEVNFLSLSGPTEMLSGIFDSYDERHKQRIFMELDRDGGTHEMIKIKAQRFETIVKNTEIDFMSVDTEGSELQILDMIDFNKYSISMICVENNFFEKKFDEFMNSKGYELYDSVFIDYIYVKK